MTAKYVNSIFRVAATKPAYDLSHPWEVKPKSAHATGFALAYKGRTILITNYHVPEEAKMVGVEFANGLQPFTADVVYRAPHYDMAILDVIDSDKERFDQTIVPLQLADVTPPQDTAIRVIGFPDAVLGLSMTEGVVSRYIATAYPFSFFSTLVLQTTCAINPGNSGGPAFLADMVVGIAFMHAIGRENVGYLIPLIYVKHVLDGFLLGKQAAFGHLGVRTQDTNPILRAYYGCPHTGGLVVMPGATEFKVGDIIMEQDGHTISDDLFCEFEGTRVRMNILLFTKYIGDTYEAKVFRNGKTVTVHGVIVPGPDLTHDLDYVNHKFIIADSFCFVPLTARLVRKILSQQKPPFFIPEYFFSIVDYEHKVRDEAVVLTDINFTPSNPPISSTQRFARVMMINDEPMHNIEQLRDAIVNPKQRYMQITFSDRSMIALDTKNLIERSDVIAKEIYGAPSAIWDGGTPSPHIPPSRERGVSKEVASLQETPTHFGKREHHTADKKDGGDDVVAMPTMIIDSPPPERDIVGHDDLYEITPVMDDSPKGDVPPPDWHKMQ
jgi:S1-C subfamily serine protease